LIHIGDCKCENAQRESLGVRRNNLKTKFAAFISQKVPPTIDPKDITQKPNCKTARSEKQKKKYKQALSK